MGAIANDWLVPLSAEFKKPYYASLYKKRRSKSIPHMWCIRHPMRSLCV